MKGLIFRGHVQEIGTRAPGSSLICRLGKVMPFYKLRIPFPRSSFIFFKHFKSILKLFNIFKDYYFIHFSMINDKFLMGS